MEKKQLSKITYGSDNDTSLKSVIGLSRTTNRMLKRSGTIFRACGLTTMQFAVLEVLYHKGDLKIGEIIEKILSTGGNMTVVINNLEREKMIEKYTDPKDSRATLIHITETGKNKIEEIFPLYLTDLRDFFQRISEDEKLTLITILKKLDA